MSLLLEDILQFLVDNRLYQGLGVDAFWDKMPDSPDSCVVAYEYMGFAEVPYEEAVHRSIQIVCRETSASLAKASVTKVHNLIRSSLDETGAIYYNGRFTQTSIRQAPFKLNEDSKNRVTFCFNLGITTCEDTLGG